MGGLLLAALLGAAPARAQQGAQQAQSQIRQTVSQALPGFVQRPGGDLSQALSNLRPEQRQAALAALSGKEDDMSGDPAALAELGSAYLALGSRAQATATADKVLAQDPANPVALGVKARALAQSGDKAGARELLARIPPGHPQAALVQTAIQLSRGASTSGGFGPAGYTAGTGSGGTDTPAGRFGQRIQSLLAANQSRSAELKGTLGDAGGATMAQLKRAGISFQRAPADQRDAVQLVENKADGTFTVSIRQDALDSRDARAVAHVGDGIRQAQTDRDHPTIGWAIIIARGWITGARIHKELAPNDIDPHPTNPSDRNLMIQRKILDQKTIKFNKDQEDITRDGNESWLLTMFNAVSNSTAVETLFERFISSTGRGNPSP